MKRDRKTISIEEINGAENIPLPMPRGISDEEQLMSDAVESLSGRTKEVYQLAMRLNYSLSDIGLELGISKWTARDYLHRAIKYVTKYCEDRK